jgi:hypothetical protein
MENVTTIRVAAVLVVVLAVSVVSAQTTTPGDAIDIEIVNPTDGSNVFCVSPSQTFTARVFVRPGTGTLSCALSCSPPSVPGGSANIATAVVDLGFDSTALTYVGGSIENNAATAAVQGIAQEQNLADSRIGWALAGTWSTPGDPASTLASPCATQMLTTADWAFQLQFQASGNGMSSIHLRRETDAAPFALSFADMCGTEAFKQSNGGIDEIRDALVLVTGDCQDAIFFDNFDNGDTVRWSDTSGS